MARQIMTEDGPVDEALLDGYEFGDRQLENVMFRIRIKDDKIDCPGVTDRCQSYIDRFKPEVVAEWQLQAEESVENFGDNLETADGREAWIEDI